MRCWADCVMLNKYGICEAAHLPYRQVEQCPQRVVQRCISELDNKSGAYAAEGGRETCLMPSRHHLCVTSSSA